MAIELSRTSADTIGASVRPFKYSLPLGCASRGDGLQETEWRPPALTDLCGLCDNGNAVSCFAVDRGLRCWILALYTDGHSPWTRPKPLAPSVVWRRAAEDRPSWETTVVVSGRQNYAVSQKDSGHLNYFLNNSIKHSPMLIFLARNIMKKLGSKWL